ncbi:ABC transporter ATP-binding protein [Vreelandella populi]|uniref:ABC transporter ATP-binding protein n=1 Tax=Vreelandella populi TaxID=2498858 RepID=UPI0021AF1388|nr:ABC transporter ATP-binding protein [Halomonas populi]
MIEIKNLYKRYHNHHGSDWVLKDINLTIPKGVSVGLIGANGAGKSTLLRLIAGMDTPERGAVIRHSRVSWPVGLSGGMQGNMTGRQNTKFVARTQGRGKDIKEIIKFVEDFAEIGEAFDEPIRTYSSGMKSRLSFGLSLAFDFDIYISDEATAVGDRAFKAKAQELFKERVGKASLIMVSHGEGILRDLCKAGIYLKKGSATWYDDINEAIADYHQDTDDKSVLHELNEQSFDVDPATLSKVQINAIQQELKSARPRANGLHVLIQQAKEQKWAKEELDVLRKAHQHAKARVDELTGIIDATPDGIRKAAIGEVAKFDRAVLGIEYGLNVALQEQWPETEQATLEKAKKLAYHRKSEKEAALEVIDGDD